MALYIYIVVLLLLAPVSPVHVLLGLPIEVMGLHLVQRLSSDDGANYNKLIII